MPAGGASAVGDETRRSRLGLLRTRDPDAAELVTRLLSAGPATLARSRGTGSPGNGGQFAFTLSGTPSPDGRWGVRALGTSDRYAAIAALGTARLPEQEQRAALAGDTSYDLVSYITKRLDSLATPADAALVCWAAAETGHAELPAALGRLTALDAGCGPVPVVTAAWVVSALVAARGLADVEPYLGAARDRLLAARRGAYPHLTGGRDSWYRAHVGSFADQVYPVQALARLYASDGDQRALSVARSVASLICQAQGNDGQWWWHYDARTGCVVERYPVYSVHQHAMAPMALFDLAEACGDTYLEPICRGLRWLARPPETSEDLVPGEPCATWRKVGRRDPAKAVRGLRAAATRLRSGSRLPVLDRVFPPGAVDHECRPYELGWLLYVWLPAATGGS